MLGPSSPDDGSPAPRPEHALLSLGTLGHPEWVPFLANLGIEPQAVDVAVANLSVLSLGELERLRALHDLGQAGRLRDMAGSARNLATGVIDPAQFDENFNKLIALASDPGLSFQQFVSSVNQQGIASTPLIIADSEACSARPTGPGPNQPTRIFGSFEASGHPHAFAYGADPLHWPACNPFFLRMLPGPLQSLPAIDDVKGTSYKTRLTEVVLLGPVEISTNLDVRYFVAQDAVGMEYAIAPGGDGRIDVDHGYLMVEVDPSRPNGVIVRSQKTVRFVGVRIPESLVCMMGWIHVMQNMASCQPPN